MKLKYHRDEIKNAFFLPKIGNVKKGAPLRRGLASPKIDATLNVDSTPCPNGDRAALRILESRYQNDTKTVFLLTFRKTKNAHTKTSGKSYFAGCFLFLKDWF